MVLFLLVISAAFHGSDLNTRVAKKELHWGYLREVALVIESSHFFISRSVSDGLFCVMLNAMAERVRRWRGREWDVLIPE